MGALVGGLLLRTVFLGFEEKIQEVIADVDVLADQHVLNHAHGGEQTDILERSRDAGLDDVTGLLVLDLLAVEEDLAAVHMVHAGEHIEDGGLAGAVGADDADDLALVDVKFHVFHGHQAAEGLGNAFYFQQCHHFTCFPKLAWSCSPGLSTPLGSL